MKNIRKLRESISVILATSILFSSCVSTTMINSIPPDAKLFIDGQHQGETPYKHNDTKMIFSTTDVRLTKEGFNDYNTSFIRDEQVDMAPAIMGFFIWPLWLWALKYDSSRTYELEPINPEQLSNSDTQTINNQPTNSKAESLRELKKLLDEGILTQEEFEKEKKKILEDD